jgi:aryl-alcohol dehydrogenase-like predicted oxidoreductase
MHKGIAHSRLILGTAQLGLPYGIANRSGKPDMATATRLVQTAWEGGVRLFDTAQAYGASAEVFGAALRTLGLAGQALVISKLVPSLVATDAPNVPGMVHASLGLLGVSALHGLMLHREEQLDLLDGPLGVSLQNLVTTGIVRSLGVSVYTPEAAIRALRHPLISLLQVPASLFDRRFETAGVFTLAYELGKEVHVRSALLQGVLCMEPEALPTPLAPLGLALTAFHEICADHALPHAALALAWTLRRHPKAFILFGAETPGQVRQNLDMLDNADRLFPVLTTSLEAIMPPQTDTLLNPSLWNMP